jgi:uncharacterized protein
VETEPMVAIARPMADLGLYLADMASWPRWARARQWLESNEAFRRRVLDLLRASGPLPSRDIPDTSEVPWASTGWTNDRNVIQMLEILASRGEVAVAGRRGRQRLWDVAERVYPTGMRVVPEVDATADRRTARLHVHAVHQDVPFTRAITKAVHAELHALAQWLGLDDVQLA